MSEACLKCGSSKRGSDHSVLECSDEWHLASRAVVKLRKLMFMMHPIGQGADRSRNLQLAAQWQAAIQADRPEWVVVAPYIALATAWTEERRAEGLAVNFATIDISDGGIIAGSHVSPGMGQEIQRYRDLHPEKVVHDFRGKYKFAENPFDNFRPKYEQGRKVYVEGQRGECEVLSVEAQAPGIFRYLLERTEQFTQYEQFLTEKPQ